MKLDTLQDVLVEQLADLYDAEKQLVKALPKVAKAASTTELRDAVEHHLEETQNHVKRLESMFKELDMSPPREHCDAMEGLIKEADEIIGIKGDPAAKDAALIAAAQRVEHYEIAAYGTAKTLAGDLGLGHEIQGPIGDTLDEESAADTKLTKIATGGLVGTGINQRAT